MMDNINKLLGAEAKKYVRQERWNDIPLRDFAIPVEVSFDMGWQKRSSGRVYDSLSGHGFLLDTELG